MFNKSCFGYNEKSVVNFLWKQLYEPVCSKIIKLTLSETELEFKIYISRSSLKIAQKSTFQLCCKLENSPCTSIFRFLHRRPLNISSSNSSQNINRSHTIVRINIGCKAISYILIVATPSSYTQNLLNKILSSNQSQNTRENKDAVRASSRLRN